MNLDPINAPVNNLFELDQVVEERSFTFSKQVRGANQSVIVKVKKTSAKDQTKPTYEITANNVPQIQGLVINDNNIEVLQNLVLFYQKPPF
jgi:hypothetical protein